MYPIITSNWNHVMDRVPNKTRQHASVRLNWLTSLVRINLIKQKSNLEFVKTKTKRFDSIFSQEQKQQITHNSHQNLQKCLTNTT